MTNEDQITGNKNIVKVEVSPFSSDEAPMFNFNSFDGSIDVDVPVDDELLARMGGESKRYFYYRKTDDGHIDLLNHAGGQDW